MTKVAVVYASKFTAGGSKKFQKYVDYMDRNEAIRTGHVNEFNIIDYDGYNDYMGNPEKTSALFSSAEDKLTSQQKKELKQQFITAKKNDSVMWQDVISFDNEWLIKYGIYDPIANTLDEKRIMDSIRVSMNQILYREGMSQSAIWSGAIHYNTKHFHVHIALVEPEPTREYGTFTNKKTGQQYTARRGYRSQTYLSEFRSKVANHLVDRDLTLGKINTLIRNKVGNKEQLLNALPDRSLKMMIEDIHHELPSDLRMWKYNMNALKDVRPKINDLIDHYIAVHKQDEMNELRLLLKEEAAFRKELYGEGDKTNGRWKDTETNKIDEIYASLGNTILKELVDQELEIRAGRFQRNQQLNDSSLANDGMHGRAISSLKRAFARNLKEARLNQKAYRDMQREIEREKEQGRSR